MYAHSQAQAPSSAQGSNSNDSSSQTPPRSPSREALHRELRTSGSFERGEALLAPTDDDRGPTRPKPKPAPEPPLQAIPLPAPVAFDLDELGAWAEASGFELDVGARRVWNRHALNPLMEMEPEDDDQLAMMAETVIKLDHLGPGGASIITTSLSASAFRALAATIPTAFPVTRTLFQTFAGLAKAHATERAAQDAMADARIGERDGIIERDGADAFAANPLTTSPVTPEQLATALPVPEGTHGVFHLGSTESIDIGSYGFVTCVGVVIFARHPNGTRSVGMAHLNSDAVERQLASFERFVAETSGGSPYDVWLVGGGKGARGSERLALSLLQFFRAIGNARSIATSLFQDGGRERDEGEPVSHSYVVHDGPDGRRLHETQSNDEDEQLLQRHEQLPEVHDVYRIGAELGGTLGLSLTQLIAVCSDGRHPMLAQNSN
ncbi:MAG: hypothetical protein U1F43_21740 [Myxococcota bacterium]